MRIFFFLFLFIGLCFSSSCGSQDEVEEIRAKIDTSIPIGSSRESVFRFLEANNFTVVTNPDWLPTPNGKKCEWVTASIEKHGIFGKYYLKVYLYFDLNTTSLIEYEAFTSVPKESM